MRTGSLRIDPGGLSAAGWKEKGEGRPRIDPGASWGHPAKWWGSGGESGRPYPRVSGPVWPTQIIYILRLLRVLIVELAREVAELLLSRGVGRIAEFVDELPEVLNDRPRYLVGIHQVKVRKALELEIDNRLML